MLQLYEMSLLQNKTYVAETELITTRFPIMELVARLMLAMCRGIIRIHGG